MGDLIDLRNNTVGYELLILLPVFPIPRCAELGLLIMEQNIERPTFSRSFHRRGFACGSKELQSRLGRNM